MKNICKGLDAALTLRLGIGMVFLIGGISKLSQLLNPEASQKMVDMYMGQMGYINSFFHEYLFSGAIGEVLTPWGFLTGLSGFEFVSGILLILGIFVRPLALIYAFLVWTFVIALSVTTTPGLENTQAIHSPAILVQIRDIALSGMLFALFILGSGVRSLDSKLFGKGATQSFLSPAATQFLVRASIAVMLLVGGFFFGMGHIPTFKADAFILLAVGFALLLGVAPRLAGAAVAALAVWYMVQKLNMDKSVIGNLNGFKREVAFFAGGLMLLAYNGKTYGVSHLLALLKGKKLSAK